MGSVLNTHFWATETPDYTMAWTDEDLETALGNGLLVPIVIPAASPLAQQEKLSLNCSDVDAADTTVQNLLQQALCDDTQLIDVQDLSASSMEGLTCVKTCQEVRARFAVPCKQRGIPWNCPKVKDSLLLNFPGPSFLERIDFLTELKSKSDYAIDLESHSGLGLLQAGMTPEDQPSLQVHSAIKLDCWLTLSEEGAISRDHADIGVGRWIQCIHGEQIIWFKMVLGNENLNVWQMSGNPCEYHCPWPGLRMRAGDTL